MNNEEKILLLLEKQDEALAQINQRLDQQPSLEGRVEALENDVALMKTVIRSLAKEVQELKKAE